MEWIHHYQLFLFDFDGLLVNTEEIHYRAYKRMFSDRGIEFNWSFSRYCQAAHYHAEGLRDQVYTEFPELHRIESDWRVLYAEKKRAVLDLINEGAVQLMPGVEQLLRALSDANIKRCVVTHSPEELVQSVRKQNAVLNTIPHWLTREHYSNPKPHSECYLKAIKMLSEESDRIIGFEDTPRGLTALLGTAARAVLICEAQYPEIPAFTKQGAVHYSTLMQCRG